MFDLFNKYHTLVRKIVRQKTGEINSDLEQEIFIRLWQKQKDYVECGKEKSWVCVIANNMCTDFFKSKFWRQERQHVEIPEDLIDDTKNPEIMLTDAERQKIILAAVNSLPSKLRAVIVMQEFEGLQIEELANRLRIPAGTVKSRIFYARKILAGQLFFLKPK